MSGPALVRQPIRKRFLTTSPCTKCRLGRASLCSWMGYKVRSCPRLCENFNVRRARRNIFEKLRDMRTDNAADIRLNAMLENCIFYISPMYEFSHSLDPKRTSGVHCGLLIGSCFSPYQSTRLSRYNAVS